MGLTWTCLEPDKWARREIFNATAGYCQTREGDGVSAEPSRATEGQVKNSNYSLLETKASSRIDAGMAEGTPLASSSSNSTAQNSNETDTKARMAKTTKMRATREGFYQRSPW